MLTGKKSKQLESSIELVNGDVVYLAYRLWDDPEGWPPPPRIVEVMDGNATGRKWPIVREGFRFRVLGVDLGDTILDVLDTNVKLMQNMSHLTFEKHCAGASLLMGHIAGGSLGESTWTDNIPAGRRVRTKDATPVRRAVEAPRQRIRR